MNTKKLLFERAKNYWDDVKFGMSEIPYNTVLGIIRQLGWEEEFKEYLDASGETEIIDALSIGLANGDTLLIEAEGHGDIGACISIEAADGNKINIANIVNSVTDPDTFSVTVVTGNSNSEFSHSRFWFSQKAKYNDCYVENEDFCEEE